MVHYTYLKVPKEVNVISRPRQLIKLFLVDEAVLTPRQTDIYKLIEKGRTLREIAKTLNCDKGYISREIKKIKKIAEGSLLTTKLVKHPPSVVHTLGVIAKPHEIVNLTPREAEVLVHYIQGADRGEIAMKMELSENTVDVHLLNAKKKLGDKADRVRAFNKNPNGVTFPGASELERLKSWMADPECKRIISLLARGESLSLADQRVAVAYGIKSPYNLEVDRAKGLNILRLSGKKHYTILTVRSWMKPLIKEALKKTNLKPLKTGYDQIDYEEEIKYKVTSSQLMTINQNLSKYLFSEQEFRLVYMYSDGYEIERIANYLIKEAIKNSKSVLCIEEATEPQLIMISQKIKEFIKVDYLVAITQMYTEQAERQILAEQLKHFLALSIERHLVEIKTRFGTYWEGVEDARGRALAERPYNECQTRKYESLLL